MIISNLPPLQTTAHYEDLQENVDPQRSHHTPLRPVMMSRLNKNAIEVGHKSIILTGPVEIAQCGSSLDNLII